MEVTNVSVYPREEDRLKAFVTITFDNCFIVRDLKIIRGNNDLFVAMPTKRKKNGAFTEVAHPLNADARAQIEAAVLDAYYRVLDDRGLAAVNEG
jgi:stage V sporulation protein G